MNSATQEAARPGPPRRVPLSQRSVGHAHGNGAFGSGALDLDSLRYEPLAERPSKVSISDLGRASDPNPRFDEWLERLPRLLGATALIRLRDAIVRAHAGRRPIVAALGGHVVKTGCGALLDRLDWPGTPGRARLEWLGSDS